MRYVPILLLCFLGNPSKSQELRLSGMYSTNFIGTESITFKSKDSFYFHGFYCNYSMSGKGTYKIYNKQLILSFERLDTLKEAQAIVRTLNYSNNTGTTDTISIVCTDVSQIPIPNAQITATLSNGAIIGTATNESGRGVLYVPKANFHLIIGYSCGLIQKTFQLTSGFNYQMQIIQPTEITTIELNSGETFVYDIRRISTRALILKEASSSDKSILGSAYYTYKRLR